MKSQLGLCFPLRPHRARPRGEGKDLRTGCGAAQFPQEGEAELAVIADAEDALDVLVYLYLRGEGGEDQGLEHMQSVSWPSKCSFIFHVQLMTCVKGQPPSL